jgi:hypothetical protein
MNDPCDCEGSYTYGRCFVVCVMSHVSCLIGGLGLASGLRKLTLSQMNRRKQPLEKAKQSETRLLMPWMKETQKLRAKIKYTLFSIRVEYQLQQYIMTTPAKSTRNGLGSRASLCGGCHGASELSAETIKQASCTFFLPSF